jgi:hypothetical protein
MVTLVIILAIALLVAVSGLAVEIGIASWNIRRAERYLRGEFAAKRSMERALARQKELGEQLDSLCEYASKASWLLGFLHKRYNNFADLEEEISAGPAGMDGDTSVGEADDTYRDLKKAMKIVRVTVKASKRMESIIGQIGQVIRDLEEEEDDSKPAVLQETESEAPGSAEQAT